MKQFLRFGLTGVVGFIADAGGLYALLGMGLNAYLARIGSFLLAVYVTWRINRHFTFARIQGKSVWREWGSYLLAMSLGGACNYAAYALMLNVLPKHASSPLLALAVGSLAGLVVNFLSAKFWVFASSDTPVRRGAISPHRTVHAILSLLAPQKLSWLYVSMAMPCCLFLAAATPPLQTPDAVNHFFRAYQVSTGALIGRRVGQSSGGQVDTGVLAFGAFEYPLKFDKQAKWRRELEAKANALRLTQDRVDAEFPNTAPYPAWNYLPQALPLVLLGHSHISVASLYGIACLANALVAIFLTCLAIRIARHVRLLIFTAGLLPMTLALSASVSQDGTLIPLAFLVIALLDRAIVDRERMSNRAMSGIAALVVLIATARLPYIGLALFYFHPSLRVGPSADRYFFSRRLGWVAMTACAAGAVFAVHNLLAGGVTPPGVSLSGQMHYLVTHPTAVPPLLGNTLAAHGRLYAASFIGVLGWLDTYFPVGYYVIAYIVCAVALIACMLPRATEAPVPRHALFSLIPLCAATSLIFIGLYAFWSPVGGATVEGVQGRYFLPIAPALGMACVPFLREKMAVAPIWDGVRAGAILIVAAFPVVSFVELVTVILKRYYIG